MGMLGGEEMPMLFRSHSVANTEKNKTLKLERREDISVECVAEKDEFERGDRCG